VGRAHCWAGQIGIFASFPKKITINQTMTSEFLFSNHCVLGIISRCHTDRILDIPVKAPQPRTCKDYVTVTLLALYPAPDTLASALRCYGEDADFVTLWRRDPLLAHL
jgi:hypothetical protein